MNDFLDAPDYARPLQDHEAKGAARPAPQGGSMKPTVGRIVHYYDGQGIGHAAVIVEVFESSGTVALYIFWRDGSTSFAQYVAKRDVEGGRTLVCWEWPERIT